MEKELFEGMTIAVPAGFADADAQTKNSYFGATPMDHVFAAEDGSAVMGIVRQETELANDAVEGKIAVYQQYYSRMVPGFVMGQMRKGEVGGQNVGLMTYQSNAPTRNMFNLLAITSLQGREVLILCACDMKDAIKYLRTFLAAVESMRFC